MRISAAVAKASVPTRGTAKVKRSGGRKPRSTESGKKFTALVMFLGVEKGGGRFRSVHEVEVRASTIFGAMGRAVREAYPLERARHDGKKCKWLTINVEAFPAE